MTVPILDLTRSFGEIRADVFAAMERIFDAQSFILGKEVKTFEEHCDSYLELPEGSSVGCASGTDALLLALMACDIHEGDEVITTPFTFFATSGTIARLGAVPVFADVDPSTYNIKIDDALSKVTSKTRAFLPVHLFGQMAPIEGAVKEFHEHGVLTIEDTAQAFGATRLADGRLMRAGTVGDVG
ncbi:MAG: DegT/DnrJ/EryC1/StrS family aminotransferase, partial [Synergistaceae bacterium]|nr:DegT/DnrJ/EryC1/StrS family aminotransferase [Synergistaceae bacterium]